MSLTVRTPKGVLARIKEIEEDIKLLKSAVADWTLSGPEQILLHFDSFDTAAESISSLATDIPKATKWHKLAIAKGLTIEGQYNARRGAAAKGDALDMGLMCKPDPDGPTRAAQKAMLDIARKARPTR